MPDNTPVIVGVAQVTNHRGHQPGPEPLDLWEQAVRRAADDAGIPQSELANADFVGTAYALSWTYDDQTARLAERLGASPRKLDCPMPSGTSGLKLVAHAAEAIRNGAEIAIVAGGEAMATRKYYAKNNQIPDWSHPAPADFAHFDLEGQQHPGEAASGLLEGVGAVYTFAMRDNARRAHLGISPEEYRRSNAELLHGMTKVAARNPDAWFPQEKSVDFLLDINDDNRLIAYPYTKHSVAIIDVDIAAAQILMSKAKADALGVPEHKRIYPWNSCYADDPIFTAVRPNLWKSPAIHAASKAVLDSAGVTMDQIDYVDLYSCFPAAVNFARDALGIQDRGGEQITVTGGLPYAGGPAAAYVCTSITKMVEKMRNDAGAIGLVSGLGMMMSNHCYGLLSARPPENIKPIDEKAIQAELDAIPEIPVRTDYEGLCTIATYTTIHDRNGDVTSAAAIVDLFDGSRAYARILDPDLIKEALETEMIGRRMTMVQAGPAGEIRAA